MEWTPIIMTVIKQDRSAQPACPISDRQRFKPSTKFTASYECIISLVAIQSMERKCVFLQVCRLSHLSVCLSVCLCVRKVYCGKTADWIRMPFGVLSGVGRGKGVLIGSGDRGRRRVSFEVNVGHPIVTNGNFVAQLFSAFMGGDAAFPSLLWAFCLTCCRAHARSDRLYAETFWIKISFLCVGHTRNGN